MKKILILLPLVLFTIGSIAQASIEGSFMVNNTEKTYAIYIPSNYDATVANPMMLGLHPFNINRWNAVSWRDTLIQFAETNDLLLVCPDGGPDGRVDDDIDTLFTSMLVDSIANWYTIDQEEKYIMGFSWGGRTTYTYGLRRTEEYKGLLAIGAAVDISVIEDVIPSAQNQAIYVLHGSQDAINTRYTPIVNALEQGGACIETNLLTGINHTIDFPNRNALLTEAYDVLKNSNCGISNASSIIDKDFVISPNPNNGSFIVRNMSEKQLESIIIYDTVGKEISHNINGNTIQLIDNAKGIIYLSYDNKGSRVVKSVLIQ